MDRLGAGWVKWETPRRSAPSPSGVIALLCHANPKGDPAGLRLPSLSAPRLPPGGQTQDPELQMAKIRVIREIRGQNPGIISVPSVCSC